MVDKIGRERTEESMFAIQIFFTKDYAWAAVL